MAFAADELDSDRRSQVLNLLGRELAFVQSSQLEGGVALTESFLLFETSVAQLDSAWRRRLSLASACINTGEWHHQIAVNGEPKFFARTIQRNGAEMLLSLARGPLPKELSQAIVAIDRDFGDDSFAKLVFMRASRIYFMLLSRVSDEYVTIVSSAFSEEGLADGMTMSAREFLERVIGLPTIIGVDLCK